MAGAAMCPELADPRPTRGTKPRFVVICGQLVAGSGGFRDGRYSRPTMIRQRLPMSSSERKVRPPIITVEAVADVFNDEEIVKVAKIADLPPGYDLAAFAVGI